MLKHNRYARPALCFSLGLLLTAIAGLNQPATAQAGTDDQGYQTNEKDSTYGDAPAGLNPLDLMHRAQQLNGRSAEEFNTESQTQINNSASDFKLLQQERMRQMQQEAAGSSKVEEIPQK